MRLSDTTKPGLLKLSFIGLYIVSIILIIVVLVALWGSPASGSQVQNASTLGNIEDAEDKRLLSADNYLHNQLNEFYQLHSQYSASEKDTNSVSTEAIKNEMARVEQVLRASIDSIDHQNFKSPAKQTQLAQITSSIKSAVDNYKESIVTNDEKALGGSDAGNKEVIVKLTSDIEQKNQRISELETQLKAGGSNKNTPVSSSADVNKLAQENKFLANSLRDVVAQNGKLAKANDQQKQTIEKLNKQIDAFRKFTGAQ